jgi:glutamate---cysteine ligase / carboxylate-amine ligase
MSLFTLGIEEEFMTIDPVTRELRSHIGKIVEEGKITLQEQVKAEMHQAVVEVGTNICYNIEEARNEVINLRRHIIELADKQNLLLGSAGTHPFSKWQDQEITPNPRYHEIIEQLQDAARANLIFGQHVHVGLPSREEGIKIMNTARYFLPHVFALSTNSPFWEGRNTGYRSFRTKVFDRFPRTGLPEHFSSAAEYDSYIKTLIDTNCIDNGKKIWWDLRLHPFFNTIEFRIFDAQMRVDETIAMAAMCQAIVAKLYKLMKKNLDFRNYPKYLINENKWRAARYGVSGNLIDFGKNIEAPYKDLHGELLDFVDDVLDELGSRKEVEYTLKMIENGTGADRQLKVFNESDGNHRKVVDYIVAETKLGVF